MQTIYIIGGGPSGMMAAYSAKLHHKDAAVFLLDSQDKLGKKLRQTGGGRCNVTANMPNDEIIQYIPKNGKFLHSSLATFNAQDIQDFFNSNDCPLKEEDHGRMFPVSNKADDIVETLLDQLTAIGVKIYYSCAVTGIDADKQILHTSHQDFSYDHVIIATGGKTLPQTGSNGVGYELAKAIGHTITPLIPAEVPLVSTDRIIQEKTFQGLAFQDVALTVYKKNKPFKTITHDLLFTHFGLSGPAGLRASFYVIPLLDPSEQKFVPVSIDFLPTVPYEELQQALYAKLSENAAVLKSYNLPKRLVTYLLDNAQDKQKLLGLIKKFPMTIHDIRGFNQAFVTNGGVYLKEINPKTMQSKLSPHVSFCGELLDINAFTGGFNITSAFSTGFLAGKMALETV